MWVAFYVDSAERIGACDPVSKDSDQASLFSAEFCSSLLPSMELDPFRHISSEDLSCEWEFPASLQRL